MQYKIHQTEFLSFEIFNSHGYDDHETPINKKSVSEFYKKLSDLKKRLETSKNAIDKYASNPNYQKIWSSTDIYAALKWDLKKFDAQFITNAWIKYYEIWNWIKKNAKNWPKDVITIFANAELPGASIAAFNHFCDTNDLKYNWFASSYAPDGIGTMFGDTYGLLKCNRNNWLMNDKNNGDCTNLENLLDLEKRIGGTIDIYSHDAGLDIKPEEYNQQESKNLHLHLGCALLGFMVLKKGGIFVAKQYTYFMPLSIELIVIYSSLFENFYITKPLTSRPFNSEIYLIGINFIGMSDKIKNLLMERVKKFNTDPILDEEFICARAYRDLEKSFKIFENQILYVDQNVDILRRNINNTRYNRNIFKTQADTLIQEWKKINPIKKLTHPLLGGDCK